MKLFDEFSRTATDLISPTESDFEYLNRSARLPMKKIRDIFEDWFSRYPNSEKVHLKGEFRNKDAPKHNGAVFELFLHELLLQLGCIVLETHPPFKLKDKTAFLDFTVQGSDGSAFYLEAVSSGNRRKPHVEIIMEAVDTLDSPNFYIQPQIVSTSPKQRPIPKDIKRFLRTELSKLDVQALEEVYRTKGLLSLPTLDYQENGISVKFRPIPKRSEKRSKLSGGTLYFTQIGIFANNSVEKLRETIRSKTKKYGKSFDLPYVIAVNHFGYFNAEHVLEALFGDEIYLVDKNDGSIEFDRRHNGVWRSFHEWVSAILVVKRLDTTTVSNANIRLYHNPWAKHPYTSNLTQLPQAIVEENKIVMKDGKTLQEIFNLPLEWPEDEKEE